MASAFELFADLLPEPMALVSPSGTLHATNRAFRAIAGAAAAEEGATLDARGWSCPDTWPVYLQRCARTRDLVVGAAAHRQADGSARAFRCEGAAFQPRTADAEATVLLRLLPKDTSSSRFVALTQKISELSAEIARRRRAEDEAHEQRELLHVTLSSIGDAVIATDTAARVTFMNAVAEQLTAWTGEEAAGVNVSAVFRIVNEQSREPVENPIAEVLRHGQIVGLANHTLLIARDGTERPIDDSGAPIVDAEGRLHGAVLVFRDVTELRRAERQQEEARRSAEAANRAKDEFLATLSHELRTPLNAILGWTRMLRSGVVSDSKRAEALAVIERNAEMQARLVDDLLDVSRIMVGQLRLQYEPVDLTRVIGAALDAVKPAADNKSLRVSSDLRLGPVLLHGDAARLQQVLWNLLTNAVKFTPPMGTISVEASEADGTIRIVVRDSGPGIPAAFASQIFDAFSQADTSFTRTQGGLGLGLTIVRRLVEAHGGTVESVSDGEGGGATFVVTLPVVPPVTILEEAGRS
ncbi:MAG TPA: ATP-binding protein [Vicinamibacterales bacterium]